MGIECILLAVLFIVPLGLFCVFRSNVLVLRGLGGRLAAVLVGICMADSLLALGANHWFGTNIPGVALSWLPTVAYGVNWRRVQVARIMGGATTNVWHVRDLARLMLFVQNRPRTWRLQIAPSYEAANYLALELSAGASSNNHVFAARFADGMTPEQILHQAFSIHLLDMPDRSRNGRLELPYEPESD